MATNPDVVSGQFITRGKLLRDLTKEITAERPSVTAKEVAQRLRIQQACDFNQQLLAEVGDTEPGQLGAYIKQYVRDNSSDLTELPAAQRFLFNPTTLASNRTSTIFRRPGSESQFQLPFKGIGKVVQHLATKPPIWEVEDNGRINFTDRGEVLVNVDMNVGATFGDTDDGSGTINWRFSDTGTNRFIVVTFFLTLYGALSTSERSMRLGLGEMMIFPEDIVSRKRIPFTMSRRLTVRDANGPYGMIESATMHLERSTWVATVGTVQDGVGLFKKTLAATPDTSNFVEVIEV